MFRNQLIELFCFVMIYQECFHKNSVEHSIFSQSTVALLGEQSTIKIQGTYTQNIV